ALCRHKKTALRRDPQDCALPEKTGALPFAFMRMASCRHHGTALKNDTYMIPRRPQKVNPFQTICVRANRALSHEVRQYSMPFFSRFKGKYALPCRCPNTTVSTPFSSKSSVNRVSSLRMPKGG